MSQKINIIQETKKLKKTLLEDYRLSLISRECSIIGRREVLNGKAMFGIFGDGKEVAQIAMAKVFRDGDFRCGYYRDQTFMMAINKLSSSEFFSGLYGDTDMKNNPHSGGRQMGCHFSTKFIDDKGDWIDLSKNKNSTSDISATASQMPRLVGIGQASKIYRQYNTNNNFSTNGNEIAFGTIGNASIAEGLFFEAINAIAVLEVPVIISIWDDEYGISVTSDYQVAKSDIYKILLGFKKEKQTNGFEILSVNGWDYMKLLETYKKAEELARKKHIPVIIHVKELTQPLGHSTSGSHERYKSKERLEWEREFDCIKKMKEWLISYNVKVESKKIKLTSLEELEKIEEEVKILARQEREKAWIRFNKPIKEKKEELLNILDKINKETNEQGIEAIKLRLRNNFTPLKKDVIQGARKAIFYTKKYKKDIYKDLEDWLKKEMEEIKLAYNSNLYYSFEKNIKYIDPSYDDSSNFVDARIIIRDNFDKLLNKYKNLMIFGQDCGKIGDVNSGLENLQKKYGKTQVDDAGIREATIIGQGIGLAMRGMKPIAEIQYLDYLVYAINVINDDLSTIHYRSRGTQKCPLIIRTRGHRLEGIWHAGSPMGMIINSLRGVFVLVPRNMTKAAGFYNTLMELSNPALIIEPLNSYRIKEKMPNNLGEFKEELGKVEVTKKGSDITVVTYGPTHKIVTQACLELERELNISSEIIDIQTLIPFDIEKNIVKSLRKTNRLLIVDEDVPGGASAYIMQNILENQKGYFYLDSMPATLTGKEHRPAYTKDGEYFSKPSVEDVFEKIYEMTKGSDT